MNNSPKYLLDSNICVYILRGKKRMSEQLKKVGWLNCCISEITVAELLYGAECSNDVIGATAVATDCIMVTENVKHLNRIENIRIENWIS